MGCWGVGEVRPQRRQPTRPWGSQSKNTGMGCHFLAEKAMATHSSTLAWEIPWMEKPGRLQSMGLQSQVPWLFLHVSSSHLPGWYPHLAGSQSEAFLIASASVRSRPLNTLSVQFSSVAQSCPTLCNPMNHSMPGLPVHHKLLEFTQTLIHQVGDAIQPSHPLSSPSPPAPNPSQHQSLFQ